MGFHFFLEKKVDNEEIKDEVAATGETSKSSKNIESAKPVVSTIILILTLVTAILKLINSLSN